MYIVHCTLYAFSYEHWPPLTEQILKTEVRYTLYTVQCTVSYEHWPTVQQSQLQWGTAHTDLIKSRLWITNRGTVQQSHSKRGVQYAVIHRQYAVIHRQWPYRWHFLQTHRGSVHRQPYAVRTVHWPWTEQIQNTEVQFTVSHMQCALWTDLEQNRF